MQGTCGFLDSLSLTWQFISLFTTSKVVRREDVVNKATYSQLEERGLVVLEQYDNSSNHYRVRLPILFTQALLTRSTGNGENFHELARNIRQLCPWKENLPVIEFAEFEKVIGKHLALKMTALWIDRQITKSSSLSCPMCRSSTKSWLNKNIDLRHRQYTELPNRFPAGGVFNKSTEPAWAALERGDVCLGGSGGVADVIFLLDNVLVFGQMKKYLKTELDLETMYKELDKVKKAMGSEQSGGEDKIDWRLVFFTNRLCPQFNNEELIPEGVILVSGNDLREFLGPIVADQLELYIESSEPLDANTATAQEIFFALSAVDPCVTLKLATRMVKNRDLYGFFKDWRDFHSRIFCCDKRVSQYKQLLKFSAEETITSK